MVSFDVAIVGAGPAGSRAARLLAQRGARVALLDPSHPREKPCGGGVTARALELVAGTPGLDALPAVRISRARFVDSSSNQSASVDLGDDPATLVVTSREAFDGLLYSAAAEAGAECVRSRVREIARGAHGWRLATADGRAVRASWLIGADGANSFVRRSVARGFPRDQISIATGYFAYGVASREVVIELVDEPPGYIWSFPRPDHLAIGICAQADAGIGADALRGRVAAWIDRTGIADGARLVPYSWPIPSFTTRGFDRTPCSGERWMTIGDAAGLVDPITREGIFFALQSAGLAADAIAHAPRDAADHFARAVRETIVADLRQAAALKQGFFRPRFTRLLVDALQRSAAIRGVMIDLIAGTQPYRELKWRLMKTFEWKLAWRLVTARDSRRAPAPAAPPASR